jgi:GSH-dependent disulfide-bond oxidoreductase
LPIGCAAIVSAHIQAEKSAMSQRSSARSSRREKVTLDRPIFTRWPAQYPDRLQLFSAPTPNGVKVGIMLEETSLAYEPHRIDIMADESQARPFSRSTPTARFRQSTTPTGRAARRSRCSNRARSYEHKRLRDRYATESARLLGVLDERLAGRNWVMGADYSIADISLLGWVRNLIGFYEARELVGFDRFLRVHAWLDRGLARPAVRRGLQVTAA